MDDLTFTFQENKNRAKLEEVYKPMEKREDLPENNAYNLKQTVRYRPGQVFIKLLLNIFIGSSLGKR